MLVATREASIHPEAHEAPPAAKAHSFGRLASVLQVAGSLLAIPVGLGSAYSIYHSNFSVEAQCQGLRGSIVSMLDKSADAATLRMLVRRDVAAFEHSCGSVDPDAVAAFKKLLSADKPAAKAVAAQPTAPTALVPAARVAAKAVAAKPADMKAAEAKSTEIKPALRGAMGSDAKWLSAVRDALVNHHPAPGQPAEQPQAARLAPPPAAAPVALPAVQPAPVAPPAQIVAPPPLPAAKTITSVPQPDTDHPVPPAMIPEATVAPDAQAHRSRFGALVARIPFVGRMIER